MDFSSNSILPTFQIFHPSGIIGSIGNDASIWKILLTVLVVAVVYDQLKYIMLKGSIAGPSWKIPFMGPFLESMDPKFDAYMAKWRSGELSCVSIFHKFVVIASTREMSSRIFNSPMFVKPCVVDSAHKLLGKDNWVFLDGKDHVEFRKGLNLLFTRSALASYLPRQEEVFDEYIERFVTRSAANKYKPLPWMPEFRKLMCTVSCRTFVGHYISDSALDKIAHDYYLITAALELVNFPIILPFTKSWYGKMAADLILREFTQCAAKSKLHVASGGEITCIMDAWVKAQQDSATYWKNMAAGIPCEKPVQLLREFTNYEIAQTVFTLLFASQDANSAATTWLFQLMADRPEILNRLREENLQARNGDRDARLTMDLFERLPYTRAVVRETLRYRPPVILVPYMAKKDFPITENYTVRKGSMVLPSVWPATHDPEVYPNPDSFDPDRWITGTAEQHPKNFLVFGTGPHHCLGQTYAQMNLMAMIGKASLALDWEHHTTPESEDIKVFATIFPKDDCLLTFRRRT
ncbi:cytochrome P450 61 [Talaromyces proteolyticus]|uniref:sterol 22-desaturase n=1 Tax=Talaromyces proteolyticus TaxID=1131652 RepID=A0AAD4L3P7_9EURO|nr:cytochrome P450 61 [Talaromyces proteolyticus]KAH8705338.1 cytochrome P450 61 [Talaromyces proteolyticus]